MADQTQEIQPVVPQSTVPEPPTAESIEAAKQEIFLFVNRFLEAAKADFQDLEDRVTALEP